MKKVVVNDINIFIDLFRVELLDKLFALPWEVYTTDFVLLAIQREKQPALLQRLKLYIKEGKLHVPLLEPEEIIDMLRQPGMLSNISFTDCSGRYYAKKNNFSLLTEDRRLQSLSVKDSMDVHGIVYVLGSIKEAGLITSKEAASILMQLKNSNPRLAKEAFE